MKYLYILLLVPLFAFGAGCNQSPAQDQVMNQDSGTVMQNEAASGESDSSGNAEQVSPTVSYEYTLDEVAEHNVKEDCWLVIEGLVYDVTNYTMHPGGDILYEECGKDATESFNAKPGSGAPHSAKARSYMANYEIGKLK
ncbi:MAG: cytochrome b5 domain-containing protein [Patescibacteria group bacterium]